MESSSESSASNKPSKSAKYATASSSTSVETPPTSVQLLETLPSKAIDENLDTILKTVRTLDIRCVYAACKTKTNLIGHDCELCSARYCLKHSLPEIHGCGEAVRRDERKKFLKPIPLKTVRHQEDLAKAKIKLEAKLKDMNLSRKQKQSSGGGRK